MELTGILIKTPKGVDEIQTRANRLVQKKRNLLIQVDGNIGVEAMVARFPTLGDIRQSLQELVDEGYVEIKGDSGTPTAAAPTVSATAEAAPSSFSDAASGLSRSLYDLVGPTADDFTGKLENARDRESFLLAARSSVMIVESFAGKSKAEHFQQRAKAIADQFFK